MIILGSNSEVAQAFVEMVLAENTFPEVYLITSNRAPAEKFARHIDVKFRQHAEIIEVDLMHDYDLSILKNIQSNLLFCATGYLGKGTSEALYEPQNTEAIININYARLVPLLNFFAQKFEEQRSGTMIVLSSVAGERGRQSNFIYGSAKAGLTAYLSGLRNYLFSKNVDVITVLPGFMATKMTDGLPLNPRLTATPQQAAKNIYNAWKSKKNTVYVLPVWQPIMLVIKNIPEFIFKKLKL